MSGSEGVPPAPSEESPSSKRAQSDPYHVVTRSGFFVNEMFWKFTSLSRSLMSLRMDLQVLRCGLLCNRAEDRESLCLIALASLQSDKVEQLQALLTAHRLELHWKLPKDVRFQREGHFIDVAVATRAFKCLKAFSLKCPPLTSPVESLFCPRTSEADNVTALKFLLESQQLHPNSQLSIGVSWLGECIWNGRFQEALLLLEAGALVDVWDKVPRRNFFCAQEISFCTPLQLLILKADSETLQTHPDGMKLMKLLVRASKERRCLEWWSGREVRPYDSFYPFAYQNGAPRGHSHSNHMECPALILAARMVSKKEKLSDWDASLLLELIDGRVNLEATDEAGQTALHWICRGRWNENHGLDKTTITTAAAAASPAQQSQPEGRVWEALLACESLPFNKGPSVAACHPEDPTERTKKKKKKKKNKDHPHERTSRYTPIIVAAEGGRWDVILTLLHHGALIDLGRMQKSPNETLLHIAATRAPLPVLTEILSHTPNTNLWSEAEVPIGSYGNRPKYTPLGRVLYKTATAPELERVRILAKADGSDLTEVAVSISQTTPSPAQDANGWSKPTKWNAVGWALENLHIEAALWLHQTFPLLPADPLAVIRADPKAAHDGTLPLFHSTLQKKEADGEDTQALVSSLFFLCAEIDAAAFLPTLFEFSPSIRPETLDPQPEATPNLSRSPPILGTPLHVACLKGNSAVLAAFLSFGCPPDTPSRQLRGASPLQVVCSDQTSSLLSGRDETVRTLLQAGAQVLRPDLSGTTPLLAAVESIRRRQVRFLREGIATETPLQERDKNLLEMLLEHVSEETATTEEGRKSITTAVVSAIERKVGGAVPLLISKGRGGVVERLVDCFCVLLSRQPSIGRQWSRRLRKALLQKDFGLSFRIRMKLRQLLDRDPRGWVKRLVLQTLREFRKDVGRRMPWESGCVNLDFILKSDDSTYGSVEWGRTFTQTFTQTPLWVNALLVRSCHFLGRGFDIESLSRMAKERNLLDGDHFIMYLNCLTVSEESWWRSKEKEEMGVEKPPEVVSEETKAVWRSLKECVDEIRKRHVGAVRWCVEQLRGRFERFRQQHNTGTQRSLISSHQPSGVSHSQTTLGELAGNVPSHESASAFSEVTTGTDERKRREPPPDEAVLNLRLFKITENLVSKVKAKEKGWDRDHLAPLCFPFGLQSFPISPQTQYQPKPLPVHFEKEGPGFLSAFVETRSRDPTDDKRGRHQHTAAISRFSSWSFEELRWHDRQLKEKEKDQQQPVLHGPGFSVPFTGPPYDFSGRDPDLYGQHQHVAAMDSLKCWSFEELRWQDMCRKRNKKEQDRVVGPLIFQPVSAAGQEKKKPPSEEPTKPVVEAALKAIRNKAGRESEAATSQLPLSVSSPSSDSLQSLHEYLEEDAETCQQCLSGNWTVGGANFTFGKPLASSYVKDAFSVFAASATTAPSPSLQESGEAERGPEDNVRFVFVREGEEYTEADSLLPNSSRGSPPYLSCGNQEAKKEGGPGGQSSSAEDDQLVSASSGAVAAAQSEDPAEVPDPLPLSLLLLREKARAMMYESLSDFRSDLATLWQNSHRIYGEKSRSPHTLAAWFLVKWGLEMLEASLLSEETQREASKAENENQTGQSAEGREGNMKKEEASQAEEEDSEAEEEEEDSDEEEGDEKEEEEPDLPDLEDAEEEENDYDDHDGYSEVEYANSGSEDDGAEYLHGFGNGLPELHAFHHLSHHYFDPGFDPYNGHYF